MGGISPTGALFISTLSDESRANCLRAFSKDAQHMPRPLLEATLLASTSASAPEAKTKPPTSAPSNNTTKIENPPS
ncbi:hypothetical protein MFIFM68171_06161 [Madurella fahalii]|uniref:Uncharacterized protein n=1 Tax=Madurella fahalii TaxID=1157608 RepID=A0ABQ0GDV3_9PEZI